MSNYTGAVPDTARRKTDWREHAICKAAPDSMYPDSNEAGIAYAKSICARCTVTLTCLIDAIRVGDDQHGIRGGLKPAERRAVAKRLTSEQLGDPREVAAAVARVLHPGTGDRDLREVWADHTYPIAGGHLGWRGSASFSYRGRVYTGKQVSFLLDRGRAAVGIVRRTCPVVECVHPLHLADSRERHQQRRVVEKTEAERAHAPRQQCGGRPLAECGTRSAYQRHIRNGEPVDEACRAANAAANHRFVHTGSTRLSA